MIGLSCRSVLFYYRILVVHQLEGLGLRFPLISNTISNQDIDMKYVCPQQYGGVSGVWNGRNVSQSEPLLESLL